MTHIESVSAPGREGSDRTSRSGWRSGTCRDAWGYRPCRTSRRWRWQGKLCVSVSQRENMCFCTVALKLCVLYLCVCVSTGRAGSTRAERQQRRQRGSSESWAGNLHQHGLFSITRVDPIMSDVSLSLSPQGPPGPLGTQGLVGQPGLPVSLLFLLYYL